MFKLSKKFIFGKRIDRIYDLAEAFYEAYKKSYSGWRKNEFFFVAVINEIGRLKSIDIVDLGSPEGGEIETRYILAPIFREGERNFAIAHNHSHNSTDPSLEDIELTKNVMELAKRLNLNFIDHIIITPGGKYFSFRQAGKWVFKELEKWQKEKEKTEIKKLEPLKRRVINFKKIPELLKMERKNNEE